MNEESTDIVNFIYVLSDPITNNVVYVGKTKNPKKRYQDHCRISTREKKTRLCNWKNKIIKSGNLPKMSIICEVIDVDLWEKYYISLFKENGIKLLNMTEGGDGLQNPSNEVRKKIGNKSRGRKMSQKTKDAIFNSTFNGGKKIICYDIESRFIGEFNNARRASESLNIPWKNISDILNGGMNFNRNYTFFFSNETNISDKLKNRIESTNKLGHIFYRIDINGNMKEYNSLIEASTENKINFRNIWLCLNNKRKTCSGYAWIYKNEINSINYKDKFLKNKNGYKVLAIDITTSITIKFDSISEASKYFKMKGSTISKYIKNGTEKKNYLFKYIEI